MKKEKPQNTGVTLETLGLLKSEETVINSSEAWFNGALKGQWGFNGLNGRNKDLLKSVEQVPKNKDGTCQGGEESASHSKAYLIHYHVWDLPPILFHLKVS